MSPRSYEQRARAEEAERTRLRVIEAVFERLREAPTEPVVIDQIARSAGVARSTVYEIFGSRSGLFDAVGRELDARSGYAELLDAKHEPDARKHLRSGMRAGYKMLAANRDIYRALHSMSQLDQDASGGVVARVEAERARGMHRLATRLADEGVLAEGISRSQAENVLWVLTSFESLDLLLTGRGLSIEAAIKLLIATAERALYAESLPAI